MYSRVVDKEIVYIYMLSGFSQKDINARVKAGREKHEASLKKTKSESKQKLAGDKNYGNRQKHIQELKKYKN